MFKLTNKIVVNAKRLRNNKINSKNQSLIELARIQIKLQKIYAKTSRYTLRIALQSIQEGIE